MNSSTYVLILAGGAGTRFWPASREHLPKQFLDITGSGKSLIRQTIDRFLHFIPLENIYVITHEQYGSLVRQHIPELSENQILLEPSRNNTAPSIAYASMKLSQFDPEGICIVAPADHLIGNELEFQSVIDVALDHTLKHHSLITLGIEPSRPDTGYGYVEFDKTQSGEVKKVRSFKEKPDQATATAYIQSQSYAWNAGIFIWTFHAILKAYQQHAPAIYNLLIKGGPTWNTPHERDFIREHYPQTEKLAVDVAIMEQAENVYTIPCDIGWSDLGTWNSLYDLSARDANGNVALGKTVYLSDAQLNLISSPEHKLIVIKGLDDFIVVDTADCLLIYPKSEEQSIKPLKDKLSSMGYGEFM